MSREREDADRGRVLTLHAEGETSNGISRRTGIPRATVQRWIKEAGGGSQPSGNRAPPPTDASTVDGPPRPPPDVERPASERVDFLSWQLSELLADLAWVRSAGMVGRIASLDARVSEVRQHLDSARGEAGRVVALDRNPGAVAERMQARQKRIDQLAAARASAKDRDL